MYFRDDKGQLDSVAESKLLGINTDNCLTCARIILDKKWDTLLRPLLKELNFLPFDARLEYLQNILVFNALNNLAPYYIRAKLRFSLMSFIMQA